MEQDRALEELYSKDTMRVFKFFYDLLNKEEPEGWKGTIEELSKIVKVKVPVLLASIDELKEDGYLLVENDFVKQQGENYIKFSYIDE